MNLSKEWCDEKFILGKSDNRMALRSFNRSFKDRFWDGYREDLLKNPLPWFICEIMWYSTKMEKKSGKYESFWRNEQQDLMQRGWKVKNGDKGFGMEDW